MESKASAKESTYAHYYELFCESNNHKVLRGEFKGGISKDLSLGQISSKWMDTKFGEHLVPLDQITYRCEYFSLFLSFFDNSLFIVLLLLLLLPLLKHANIVRFFRSFSVFFYKNLILSLFFCLIFELL
jgi:hypothetical protein